jgi:hypothetical protein
MAIKPRFGKKLRVPPTIQIKHQLLMFWLKRQTAIEAAEAGVEKTARVSTPFHIHETDVH